MVERREWDLNPRDPYESQAKWIRFPGLRLTRLSIDLDYPGYDSNKQLTKLNSF